MDGTALDGLMDMDELTAKMEARMDETESCAQCGKTTRARLDGKPPICFSCLSRETDEVLAKLEALPRT